MKAFRRTASARTPEAIEALHSEDPPGAGWHRWLLTLGATLWMVYFGLETGYVQLLLFDDPTHLTMAVAALYVIATSYIGYQAWELSRQHDVLVAVQRGDAVPMHAFVTDYLHERARCGADGSGVDATALGDLLHERIKGRTELGWFSAGLHIKLGLLGTVIGFVIMLGSLGTAGDLQAQGLDTLIQAMGVGMRVSLYHTIAGLVGSMLIGVQMLVVDRLAERLFTRIITLPNGAVA